MLPGFCGRSYHLVIALWRAKAVTCLGQVLGNNYRDLNRTMHVLRIHKGP